MSTLFLCYHSVGAWEHPMAVLQEQLHQQLLLLLRRGYRATTFTSAVLSPKPGKSLVITFDDGFRAVHDLALPVLADLGLPATAFLATAYIGAPRLAWPDFDTGSAEPTDLRPMNHQQVGALVDAGWEIGAHSRHHHRLTGLDDDALREELEGSRADCEALTGATCTSLAYPFGDVDARVATAACSAGFLAGASLGHQIGRHRPLAVPRVAVYRGDGLVRFRAKTFPPLSTPPAGLALAGAHALLRHGGGRARDRSLT